MSEPINAPDLNGMLGNLLANPAALSGIMNLIGSMRTAPQGENQSGTNEASVTKKEEKSEESAVPAVADGENLNLAALAPLLSGVGALTPAKAPPEKIDVGFDPMKRRRCLLEAIRPYLSPARCENLNLLLRILDVLSLLSSKK